MPSQLQRHVKPLSYLYTITIGNLVTYTNAKIAETKERVGEIADQYPFQSYFKFVDDVDIYAVIGLMIIRGLLGLNNRQYSIPFATIAGHPVFSATMSRDRFKFVVAHLTFDDVKQRPVLWKSDRFAALRAMFEKFNKNCSKWLEPSEFLSLDETLYPMRHQIAFRQYNPDKPAKYGLLFKSINDARYPFTYTSAVYAGKPEVGQGPYYLSGTENIVKHLIENLQSSQQLQGCNISMDRLYTSYSLFQWLLKKNITAIGTFMSNRHGIPDELKSARGFAEFESQIYWEQTEKKVVLSSDAVKTKSRAQRMF